MQVFAERGACCGKQVAVQQWTCRYVCNRSTRQGCESARTHVADTGSMLALTVCLHTCPVGNVAACALFSLWPPASEKQTSPCVDKHCSADSAAACRSSVTTTAPPGPCCCCCWSASMLAPMLQLLRVPLSTSNMCSQASAAISCCSSTAGALCTAAASS